MVFGLTGFTYMFVDFWWYATVTVGRALHHLYLHLEPQGLLFCLGSTHPKTRPFPIKTRVIFLVLGILYIHQRAWFVFGLESPIKRNASPGICSCCCEQLHQLEMPPTKASQPPFQCFPNSFVFLGFHPLPQRMWFSQHVQKTILITRNDRVALNKWCTIVQ